MCLQVTAPVCPCTSSNIPNPTVCLRRHLDERERGRARRHVAGQRGRVCGGLTVARGTKLDRLAAGCALQGCMQGLRYSGIFLG